MKNELNASSQRTQTTLKSSTYNVQIGNCTWALAAAAAATAYALFYNVDDAYVSGRKNWSHEKIGQNKLWVNKKCVDPKNIVHRQNVDQRFSRSTFVLAKPIVDHIFDPDKKCDQQKMTKTKIDTQADQTKNEECF